MDSKYDYIIIGSGFGGSVSALRLSEKGYRVLLVEQGRKFNPKDYATTNWNFKKYLWWPGMVIFLVMQTLENSMRMK